LSRAWFPEVVTCRRGREGTKRIRTIPLKAGRRRLLRRPRTTKGWLITIAAAVALLTIKLTVGAGAILLLWHLLH
jgi:hypothetical protein